MVATILVLGGYGNFGYRIAEVLARESDVQLLIAGRDAARAVEAAMRIGVNATSAVLDYRASDFADRLRTYRVDVVVNAAGPFQDQDYSVARACLAARCHYVDIADARDFVTNIGTLNGAALANDVLLVSGASSVPGLSSAVVKRYRDRFAELSDVELAITAGAKPPGTASLRSVFAYTGKRFLRFQRGAWRYVYGWQDARCIKFGPLGRRWLMNCDVPDLCLFPGAYRVTRSVVFRAGTGMSIATLSLWVLSWLVRARMIRQLEGAASTLQRLAQWLEPLGTRRSGMRVSLGGLDEVGTPQAVNWTLIAEDNHGPYVPCAPAIALTRKLVRGQLALRGAMPCLNLVSVEEILDACAGLKISVIEE